MPTIKQLPTATSVNATDVLPVSQSGVTRGLSVGGLLSSVQPALTLAAGKLLGRVSPTSGAPEVVGVGAGLNVADGSVVATASDHIGLPPASALLNGDEVVVNSAGVPKRMAATALRGLFSAGTGVTIGTDGTIASSAVATPATGAAIGSVKPGSGLTVAADGTLSVSTAFTIGTVPSILHTPFGSAPPTLGSLVVQSTDDPTQPATRQFGSTFGMVALTGQPSGDAAGGDRSTMYIGMAAQPGAGGTRALTVSHGTAPGYAGHVVAAVEVDIGSGGPHRGDLADYDGQRFYNADGSMNPVFFSMSLDGVSSYRVTGALRLAGQSTTGGPLYNYGISVDTGCVSQVTFGDFCNSDRSIADFGSHRHWADVSKGTYARSALLLGAGHSIAALDAGGVERRLMAKRASDGAVLLGDSDAGVVMAVAPRHPTPALSDSSDLSATTAYVSARIASLGGGVAGPAGQGFTLRGAWTANTAYAAYDVVTYGGQVYSSPSAIAASSSFNAGSWTLLAAKGADGVAGPAGAAGQGFTFRGAWSANTAYAAYDVLTYAGQTYAVVTGFTSSGSFSANNLSLMASGAGSRTVAVGLSAAGTTQAAALALAADDSVVGTVPSGSGVTLRAVSGQRVLNRGTGAILVYPPVGGSIENGGVNAPVSIPAGGSALFVSSDNATFFAA